jgi:hypothetical protein
LSGNLQRITDFFGNIVDLPPLAKQVSAVPITDADQQLLVQWRELVKCYTEAGGSPYSSTIPELESFSVYKQKEFNGCDMTAAGINRLLTSGLYISDESTDTFVRLLKCKLVVVGANVLEFANCGFCRHI